ncbi:MAG TPA: porin family protein [Cyclobacteriaceae bacterium]|nr:porin family protein [Cyclobacteriaceae bacterium]
MKRFAFIILACFISLNLSAQEEDNPNVGRPDVTGDLFLDLGFNVLNNRPENLSTRFFPSRVANVYYQYPISLGAGSRVTFNPGIGLGMEKLAFKNDSMLVNDPSIGANSSRLAGIRTIYGDDVEINVNTTAINYVDIPLEFRYHLNKNDHSKGFRFALGGKVGFLMNSHTKVEITEPDGLTKKIKTRQDFGLNPIRYGVYTRVGLSGFNLWAYYGLNKVFKEGKGPFGTEATQFNFGVSVALF